MKLPKDAEMYLRILEQKREAGNAFPCENGHFDCFTYNAGPCEGEVLSMIESKKEIS